MARILVADDVATVRLLVRVACEQIGHEVHEALDAGTAIEAYGRVHPELLILDLGMPGGGGTAVLKALRGGGERRTCPVLVITGDQDTTPAELRQTLAVDGVLPKPFRMAELQVQVVQVLQRAHDSPPAPRAP